MPAQLPYLIYTDENYEGIGERGFPPGGGDGMDGGMEARVTSLEKRFDRFDGKLDILIKDVSEMKGRMISVPTIWQLVSINATMLALAIAGGVIALTILRFIEAAPKP